jgi:hypothetical protein
MSWQQGKYFALTMVLFVTVNVSRDRPQLADGTADTL